MPDDTHSHPRAFPLSDHFDGRRFFTPGVKTDKTWRELRHWRRTRTPERWPSWVDNALFPPPSDAVPADDIAITHIGHATLLIQTAGCNLLTDPVFSERVGPFPWAGPRRVRAPGLALAALPPIHAVLLSHNHYDHLDLPSLKALQRRWHPIVLTGLGNRRYLARAEIGSVVELDWWQSHALPGNLLVTFVPAQHWSQRWPFDRRRSLWGGHMVRSPAGQVYFAGDTGYPADFRGIRQRLGAPDFALLPIGAYEPRWFMAAQHMNPDDAVRAHLDLGARTSIAMHWGTFQLTDEAIDAPVRALDTARRAHGLAADEFRVLAFGETLLRSAVTQ